MEVYQVTDIWTSFHRKEDPEFLQYPMARILFWILPWMGGVYPIHATLLKIVSKKRDRASEREGERGRKCQCPSLHLSL